MKTTDLLTSLLNVSCIHFDSVPGRQLRLVAFSSMLASFSSSCDKTREKSNIRGMRVDFCSQFEGISSIMAGTSQQLECKAVGHTVSLGKKQTEIMLSWISFVFSLKTKFKG